MKKLSIGASVAALGLAVALAAPAWPSARATSGRFRCDMPWSKGRRRSPHAFLRKPDPLLQGPEALGSELQAAAHHRRQAGSQRRLVHRLAYLLTRGGDAAAPMSTREIRPRRSTSCSTRPARVRARQPEATTPTPASHRPQSGRGLQRRSIRSEYAKVNGEWRSPDHLCRPTARSYNRRQRRRRFAHNAANTIKNTGPKSARWATAALSRLPTRAARRSPTMYNNNIQIVVTPDHVLLDTRTTTPASSASRRRARPRRLCPTASSSGLATDRPPGRRHAEIET